MLHSTYRNCLHIKVFLFYVKVADIASASWMAILAILLVSAEQIARLQYFDFILRKIRFGSTGICCQIITLSCSHNNMSKTKHRKKPQNNFSFWYL